ncbi:hypothetical protein CRG98_018782 [Punica granatum]|uniref:Uncharacterized protein n=1 Tax=Punica granatum TaxID=22663 RepID=A0A2I0JY96_PUNGR|nr:hypothetical protein CRG98_018782 [Punica granatum]
MRASYKVANNVKSPNSSKSRVIYLASGYEERVREVFESRVTRLNAWKSARVQGACGWSARETGRRAGMQACALACASERARGACAAVRDARAGARLALLTRE